MILERVPPKFRGCTADHYVKKSETSKTIEVGEIEGIMSCLKNDLGGLVFGGITQMCPGQKLRNGSPIQKELKSNVVYNNDVQSAIPAILAERFDIWRQDFLKTSEQRYPMKKELGQRNRRSLFWLKYKIC